MTLFGAVSDKPIFAEAIEKYYSGNKDIATLSTLERMDGRL
jgi:uncharacterized protein (DUF1810 family)